MRSYAHRARRTRSRARTRARAGRARRARRAARGAAPPRDDSLPETPRRRDGTAPWDAAVGKLVVFSARIETCASEERSASAREPARPHANDASANTASARAYHRAHSAPAAEDEMSGNTASGRNATVEEPTSSTYAFTRRSQRSLDAFAASGWERASRRKRATPRSAPRRTRRARARKARLGKARVSKRRPSRDAMRRAFLLQQAPTAGRTSRDEPPRARRVPRGDAPSLTPRTRAWSLSRAKRAAWSQRTARARRCGRFSTPRFFGALVSHVIFAKG